MFRRLLMFFFVILFCMPLALHAASLPDSGQILREQEKQPTSLPEKLPTSENRAGEISSPENDFKVVVRSFKFSGGEPIATESELQQLVSPAIGKSLGMVDLRNVVAQVTNYLRDKGYFLARAYLPQQEIVDGVVKIAIIAGQVEAEPTIKFSGPVRIKEQVLRQMAKGGAQSGSALQQNVLERSVLLMNDLPGVSAKTVLERGEAPGSTKVIIAAEEGPLFNGLLSIDNFGNRYTGQLQWKAQAAVNDLSGLGDQFSLSLTGAEGLFKGTLGYQIPLGASGLKANFSYADLRYELGKEYKSLDAEGTAQTLAAGLSYPLIRSRNFSLWQVVDYEYRKLADEANGEDTSDRTLHVAISKTTLNSYDHLAGGGLTNLSLQINAGDLDYALASEAAMDATTAKAEGSYFKINYALSRLQRLTQNFSLFAAFNGQLASQNLDSSEKFILGGPSGVRAYPVGEASGDEGYSFTTEVRYGVPREIFSSNIQCVLFFDTGQIKLHDSPWTNSVTNATGKNCYNLSGTGFGVNLDRAGVFSVRASIAQVIGNNSGRSTDNRNADNQDNDQQVWLQAILWF